MYMCVCVCVHVYVCVCVQRLRDLRQWECSRKFGGHRSEEEGREKEMAAHAVAVERALMLQR